MPKPTVRAYRKKPVEVEAVRLLGDATGDNGLAVAEWCGGEVRGTYQEPVVLINTLEGVMRADPGDWIIRGVKGEFYPCKPDVFETTYESVDCDCDGCDVRLER